MSRKINDNVGITDDLGESILVILVIGISTYRSQMSSKETKKRLEDLSNELIYEIFDYLDGFDMLEAFSNLNQRFQTLVNHSSIPIKLKYPAGKSMSVKDYCEKLLLPNKHRLQSVQMITYRLNHNFFDFSIFDT